MSFLYVSLFDTYYLRSCLEQGEDELHILKQSRKKKSNKSSRLIHYFLTVIMLILMISPLLFLPSSISARPLYSKDLPPSLKNYCQVCHTSASGGPLNKFGNDYQRFNFNISAISTLDSDGDGFTNSEELTKGTLPGDPTSYPGAPPRMPIIELVLIAAGSLLLFVLVRIYITKTRKRVQ